MFRRRWLPATVAKNCAHFPIPSGNSNRKAEGHIAQPNWRKQTEAPEMVAPARTVSSCLRGNQEGRFELEFKAPLLCGCAPRLFHGVWWRAAVTVRLLPVLCVLTQHAEKVPKRMPIPENEEKACQANFRSPLEGSISPASR